MVNGFRCYRALESVSWQSKLQLPTARKKEWRPAIAGSSPHAVTCQHCDTHSLVGLEPATFRSLVDCWSDALPVGFYLFVSAASITGSRSSSARHLRHGTCSYQCTCHFPALVLTASETFDDYTKCSVFLKKSSIKCHKKFFTPTDWLIICNLGNYIWIL